MRKIILLIVISIFITANSAQATMISIFDIKGTVTGASSLLELDIYLGSMDILQLRNAENGGPFLPGDYNRLVRIQPNVGYYAPLKAMLERTFTPYMIPGPNGDPRPAYDSEMNHMWDSNQLYGSFWFFGADADGVYNGINIIPFSVSPIPDLSPYIINDLYVYPDISSNGPNIIDYHIPIFADVSPAPVPEPSTLLLLGGGLAGLAFWMKRKPVKLANMS